MLRMSGPSARSHLHPIKFVPWRQKHLPDWRRSGGRAIPSPPERLASFSRAGLHRDYSNLKYHDPYINSVDNTPSRQAGSFPGLRRLAEGDAKTAHRAVSLRSALFIAGPLGLRDFVTAKTPKAQKQEFGWRQTQAFYLPMVPKNEAD